MPLKIEIDTANAAFGDGYVGHELARILKELATKCEDRISADTEELSLPLRDYNGQTVGRMTFTPDSDHGYPDVGGE